MDIVWQADDGTVSIWCLNGVTDGIEVTLTPNPGPEWQVIGIGDFDHDGCDDILFQNGPSGTIGMWIMNTVDGSNTMGPKFINGADPVTGIITIGQSSPVVGVGDFNGDHKDDILLQSLDGTIFYWTMSGSTITGTQTVGNYTGANWKVSGVGDFNGDGKDDILIRNTITGTVAVVEVDADTYLAGPNPGVTQWEIIDAGDVDGDGKAEIIWRTGNLANTVSGEWAPAIWFNRSSVSPSRTFVQVGPQPMTMHLLLSADFSMDGKDDLLFQPDSGEVLIVTMNGATPTQVYNFGGHQDASHGAVKIKGAGKFYKFTVVLVQ